MFGIRMLAGVLSISMILNGAAGFARKTLLQQGIAEDVLRFHVLANSDSEEDQKIKLKVRDTVLEWAENVQIDTNDNSKEYGYSEKSENSEKMNSEMITKKQISEFLQDHLEEIKELADKVLWEHGCAYKAIATIESCYFPDRTYRDCTFPAGWYDALRIELGEAKGQNWWCVFYPRLCFADYLHVVSDQVSTETEMNETLEELLTVEEYELLLQDTQKWKIGFRWF